MKDFENVLIIGYGKSGKGVEKILKKNNISYRIYDDKIRLNGGNYLDKLNYNCLKNFDCVVVSPGFYSKKIIRYCNKLGINYISELEFGYKYLVSNIISVTGTNGKTTTVTLINEILKRKRKSIVAGNIGVPLTEVCLAKEKYDCVVCEVSSFQLENIKEYKSNINILLNLGDDHLDRYKSFKNYIKAKGNIFKNNSSKSVNILNYDDENIVKNFSNLKGVNYYFSLKNEVKGIYVKNDNIFLNINKNKSIFCSIKEFNFPKLFMEDILSSILVGVLMGVEKSDIISTIKDFKLLNSRMENVGTFNGVTYINDSKATNMHAVLACVNSLDSDIILMLGGRNKGFKFKELLCNLPNSVKEIICFGECGGTIYKDVKKYRKDLWVKLFTTLDEGICYAFENAWINSKVVLSPACASFDEFISYEERGEFFKNKVIKLGLKDVK